MKVDTCNMRATVNMEVVEFIVTFLASVFVPFTIGIVIGFMLAGGRI